MATYLVTGGAGFIGSHIVQYLVKNNQKVKVIDNLIAGRKENLEPVINDIEFIEADIRDLKKLMEISNGVDFCLHQAALRSVPKSVNNPLEYNDVNVTGTLNVLMAAKENKIKRVIFASSSSVYGEADLMPQKEEYAPLPISPYAATKLAGEIYCRMFSKIYNLFTVSLRYFNVFGPRQSLESQYAVVVPKFINCALDNIPAPIHGDGKQSRDFTYVDNVVQANIKAVQADGISGEVFNVAMSEDYSVLDLLKNINELLDKNIKADFIAPRPGDVQRTLADIKKAKDLLGFSPKVDFREGLKRTIEYFKK